MGTKKIVVYSQPSCPPCHAAKDFLTERGIEFTVRDVSADPSAVRELVGTYKSRTTPTIVVDDKVMIGFDPVQLKEWLAK